MARPYDEIADQVQSGEEDAVARLREVVTARRDERGEHAYASKQARRAWPSRSTSSPCGKIPRT